MPRDVDGEGATIGTAATQAGLEVAVADAAAPAAAVVAMAAGTATCLGEDVQDDRAGDAAMGVTLDTNPGRGAR